ncbi:MAG: PAS domain S-box protein [Deltaproteobacteria bacterium]|nr:PAS domain S-box protein [Deltaproteobacteria bacterium]
MNEKIDILGTIQNLTPEFICIVGKDRKVLFANRAFSREIMKVPEEIVGHEISEILPEKVAKRKIGYLEEVFRNKTPFKYEEEISGKYFEIHINPLLDEKGEVSQVLVVGFDITDRKEAESKALAERDQMFSIFESIDEVIYVSDMDTYEVLYANDFLKRMLGKDPVGGKCYKEFQGFDEPCSFCTNEIIIELKGQPYRWEYYNPILNRYYYITDRTIKWINGKDVRFELAIDITDKKNAETALRISEEFYRSSIASLREGFGRVAFDGKIIMVNPSFARIYGYSSPDEMITSVRNIRDLYVNPNEREIFLRQLMEKGYVENFESQRKTKDGRIIWVSINATLVRDENGKPLYINSTVMDITEKKKAYEELLEERQKFSILVENIPFGVLLIDRSGKYLYANKRFTEITGYTLDDVPDGKTFIIKAFPDEESKRMVISLWREDVKKFKVGVSIPRTFTVKCKSGELKRITIMTVQVAQNRFVMTFEDVTEKEEKEILLRESEKRFRSIFENAFEGIFQTTRDGEFIMANPAFVQMLGYSSFEELKQEVKDIAKQLYVNPSDRERLLNLLDEKGKVINFETQFLRKDGEIIWVNTTAWPVFDEKGNFLYIQGITEDVTERKKKEEELNLLREQFLQAQKMEAIGRLAGGIAHDFNNILTVIIGTCQLALLNLKDEQRLKRNIETILDSAEKAASLTKQLLAYSRRQLMKLEVVNLNKLIEDMRGMLERILGEDIEILTYLEKNLGNIKADPAQMQQVIINLAVNARDAMPDGGKLIIETYNVDLTEQYAKTHFGVSPGRYVLLSITDTGMGIPKEIMPYIFEPFFTTKEGEGTGLGLSTVYGIVKQLGGHIYVYSEEKKGTTFKIYLPRIDTEEMVEAKPKIGEEKPVEPSEKTILLIEDDKSVLKVISEMLQGSGFSVLEAENESRALEIAKSFEGKIDVILTDVIMPRIKAPALIVKIRSLHPEAKVIFMSGYTENVIAQYGILYPGVNYIQKPFTPEELKKKILEVLKKD